MANQVYTPSGTLTNIAKIFKEHFEKPFIRTLDRDNFLVNLFGRKNGVGHEVQWIVHYDGNSSAQFYTENDDYQPAGTQSYERAHKPFKMVRIVYGISGLAEAATRGEGALIDALAEYSKQAMEDLIARINVQLLSTTPNATADEYQRVEMDGLGDIIRDSGTYATINRTTATWWRSVVLDNGGTARPLAMPLMQQMMDLLDTPRRDAKTSHILCNRVHFNQYGNLLEDRRRWVNTIELDGGIKALEYVGIPVVPVRQMNPGVMYFIDKRDWNYYVLLPFETEEIPTTKDQKLFAIKHYAQLVCKAPFRQGVIADLQF
jgi:hypothetical protein